MLISPLEFRYSGLLHHLRARLTMTAFGDPSDVFTEERPAARLCDRPVFVNVSDLGASHAEEALLQ